MTRVRVTFGERAVVADGVTLAHAVRGAIRQLGLGSGRTIGPPERLAPGEWRWNWSGHLLLVHEIRPSGTPGIVTPRGERRRKCVELTLSDEAREKLDTIAAREYAGNRSALVEALILRAE